MVACRAAAGQESPSITVGYATHAVRACKCRPRCPCDDELADIYRTATLFFAPLHFLRGPKIIFLFILRHYEFAWPQKTCQILRSTILQPPLSMHHHIIPNPKHLAQCSLPASRAPLKAALRACSISAAPAASRGCHESNLRSYKFA